MGKTSSKRISSGEVTVNGVTARRTKKAGSPRARHSVRELEQSELRAIVYRMTIEGVSQSDQAEAVGLSQPRISQLLKEAWNERQVQHDESAAQVRELELAKIDHFIGHWAKRAKSSSKAAEVVLAWNTRADRIRGLYTDRHEISGPGGGPIHANISNFNWSALDDTMLAAFEWLTAALHGEPVPPASITFTLLDENQRPALEQDQKFRKSGHFQLR